MLVIRAFAEFEAAKMLAFARAAFNEVTPDAPQDGWLRGRGSLIEFTGDLDYEAIALLMESEDEAERDQKLEAEAEAFEAAMMERLKGSLREVCRYGPGRMDAFVRRYEWHRRYYEITQDLGDDSFEITVEMPGELVGSNADETQGNRATWRFGGPMFRDRDLELIVSSRVVH